MRSKWMRTTLFIVLALVVATPFVEASKFYQVIGNSMNPTIQEGNIIEVLEGEEWQDGDMVVAELQDGTKVIKRLEGNKLIGDNRGNTAVYDIDDVTILGKAKLAVDIQDGDNAHLEKVEASTLQIKDVPVGSIVKDTSWTFQRRSGDGYTPPNTSNENIEWMVVDTNSHFKQSHYENTDMADHVTIFTDQVISIYNFDPSNNSSPWGTRSVRTTFLRDTFYNAMNTNFRDRIVLTKTKTGPSAHGSVVVADETVFLLSATELGGVHHYIGANDGVRLPFFSSALGVLELQERAAAGEYNSYWTRTPHSNKYNETWIINANGHMGTFIPEYSRGIRPALNLESNTLVRNTGTTKTNAAGQTVTVYEIVYNTPPTLSLNTPTNNLVLSEVDGRRNLTISGTVQDADNDSVTISATVGGRSKSTVITNTSTSKNWSLTWDVHSSADNIAEGNYSNIVVSANDGKGGTASANYTGTITVDKTLPTINANPVNRTDWETTQVNIQVTLGDALSGINDRMYQLTQSSTPGATWVTAPSNTFNVNVNTEGEWYLHVRVIDRSGNVRNTTYGVYRYFVLHEPENIEISQMTTQTVTVSWDISSGHEYLVRLKDENDNVIDTVDWGATSPLLFENLDPNTKYIPEVVSRKYGKESGVQVGNEQFTDAAAVTSADFEPMDQAIRVTLNTEATGNPAGTQYEIRNVRLNETSPVVDQQWINQGLQNDMYYQYMARVIHRNGKEGTWYFIGEGHTILTQIDPPPGWEDEVGGIEPINLPSGFDPDNMAGKVVEFEGKKAIVVVGRYIHLSAEGVENAEQYAISLDGHGYGDWKDFDSNGDFNESIWINQSGFYPVHLKFRNQYGRESDPFIKNYLVDWILPETSSKTKIKGQTATTSGSLTIKATGTDNLSPILYNAGSGWQWFTSGQDITITGIPLNNQRHDAVVRFSDLNGNVSEEVHKVWGISN